MFKAMKTALIHIINSDWFSQGFRTYVHISVRVRAEFRVEY